jgi:hypothetical protein
MSWEANLFFLLGSIVFGLILLGFVGGMVWLVRVRERWRANRWWRWIKKLTQ